MAKQFSKNQVDKLGERLKQGKMTSDDLRMLDQYRRSFAEPYEFVVGELKNGLSLNPIGRPTKSTSSIVEKLRRESIRLTQIQDIAGCRLVVKDIAKQDEIAQSLRYLFNKSTVLIFADSQDMAIVQYT